MIAGLRASRIPSGMIASYLIITGQDGMVITVRQFDDRLSLIFVGGENGSLE